MDFEALIKKMKDAIKESDAGEDDGETAVDNKGEVSSKLGPKDTQNALGSIMKLVERKESASEVKNRSERIPNVTSFPSNSSTCLRSSSEGVVMIWPSLEIN